ncbi:hypothetical protein BGX28_004655 [Mortierella sp. GBA30]|nr:hypothetical protein BGX28_004655 [Mortierella sp. GBA30]
MRHNRRQVYPNDTLPPVSGKVRNIDYDHFFSSRFYAENGYSEDASDSDFDICKGEDPLPLDEDAATSGILLPKEQDIYFGDMPLELLNHIFLDFMRISNESLQSLAQERNEARIKASQMTSPSSASASATVTLTDLSSAGNAIDSARAEIRSSRNTTFWHAHRGHQRRRHRHPYHQHQHDVEYGLFQDLHIATQSTSLSSSSASLSSHLATDSQLSDAASNLVLVTDQDLSYDGEQEEDEDEEGNSNNDADSDISDEFQEEALDSTEAAAGFNDDGSEYSTASVDRGISQLGESSDSGSHDIDFAYRDDTATQSATSSSPPTSPASPSSYSEDEDYDDDDNEDEEDERSYESDHDIDTENSRPSSFRAAVATTGSGNVVKSRRPRLGINRVDSDLDEDKMLYQLHRDQHFHPTTHTSLRSDLYICSLVNRILERVDSIHTVDRALQCRPHQIHSQVLSPQSPRLRLRHLPELALHAQGTATAFSSHSSATATQSSAHPERLRNITSGWWQWTGLRKLEIQLKNTVLPREWLQDLTAAIAQNSLTLTKKEQYFQQQQRLGSKLAIIPRPHDLSTRELGSEFVTSYGPPLEVINIDCEVSHPHKDIFMDFIRVWGHHMEEFHFSQSGELTDEFFWLCLQRMTRLKKLSLRDSKGITGEGINTRLPTTAAGRGCQEDKMTRDNLGNLEGVVDSLAVQSALSSIDVPADGGANTTTLDAAIQENLAPYPSKASTRKAAKVPILWRRDFKELHLDQSRIRQEFLQTLRRQCPGVMYKVREVRHRAI